MPFSELFVSIYSVCGRNAELSELHLTANSRPSQGTEKKLYLKQ